MDECALVLRAVFGVRCSVFTVRCCIPRSVPFLSVPHYSHEYVSALASVSLCVVCTSARHARVCVLSV